MNFQDAFENLFNFDNSAEAIVFGAILLLTFLLGMLIWFLLAHLPQRNRSRKDLKILNSELESLDKDHSELLEKHTVQSAKVQRLEEDANKNDLLLVEKDKKIAQIQQLYTHLESERDKNYGDAEAAKRELIELKNFVKVEQVEAQESIEKEATARKERDEALAKVEEIKGLMEEMEKDRHAAGIHLDEDKQNFASTQYKLQEANMALETLQKEFDIVNDQLQLLGSTEDDGLLVANQKLETELLALQSELIQQKGTSAELEAKLIAYETLASDVKGMREEQEQLRLALDEALSSKRELETRLDQQANMELQLTDTEVGDNILDQFLSDTRSVMEAEGFFTEIDSTELIEDEDLLNENLSKEPEIVSARTLDLEEPVDLTESEAEDMNLALNQAEGAMNLQGFFGDMDSAVLIESEDTEVLDDDAKMERALEESATVINQAGFFNSIEPEDIIEDLELLELQLKQEPEVQARGLGLEERLEEKVVLNEIEKEHMSGTLESVEAAMKEEGLYGEIDINNQLESTKESNEMPKEESSTTYRTSIEKAVMAEINQLLPSSEGKINDDLKRINGIGSVIEEKLNRMGIRTYEQLSKLKEPVFLSRLTMVLGLPAGSIERDQWIYQAKQLLTKQKINDLTKDIDLNKLFKK